MQRVLNIILLSDTGLDKKSVTIYARVSSSDQKADLDAQVLMFLIFAIILYTAKTIQ